MTNINTVEKLTKELFIEENTRVLTKEVKSMKFFEIDSTEGEVQTNGDKDITKTRVKKLKSITSTIVDKAEIKLYQLVWKNPIKEDEKYCAVVLSILDVEKDRVIAYRTLFGGKLPDSTFDKHLAVLQDLPNMYGCLYLQKLLKINDPSRLVSGESNCVTSAYSPDYDMVNSIVSYNESFVVSFDDLNGDLIRDVLLECDPDKIKVHMQHIYDECYDNDRLYSKDGKLKENSYAGGCIHLPHLARMVNSVNVQLVSIPDEFLNGLKDELLGKINDVMSEREKEKEDIVQQSEEYRRFALSTDVNPDINCRRIMAMNSFADNFTKYREWYNSLDMCKSNILQLGILSGYIKSGYGDITIKSLSNMINRILYGFNVSDDAIYHTPSLISDELVNFDLNIPVDLKDELRNIVSSEYMYKRIYDTNAICNHPMPKFEKNRLATQLMSYITDEEGSDIQAVSDTAMKFCLRCVLTMYINYKLVIDHDKLDKVVAKLKSMLNEYKEDIMKKQEILLPKFSDPSLIDDRALFEFRRIQTHLQKYNDVLSVIDKNVSFIKTSGLKTIGDLYSYNEHQYDDINNGFSAIRFIEITSEILRDGVEKIDRLYSMTETPSVWMY